MDIIPFCDNLSSYYCACFKDATHSFNHSIKQHSCIYHLNFYYQGINMSEVVQGAKSFSRSISILQLISDQKVPVNTAALLKLCDLTKPTLYRILAALEAENLVIQNSDKTYQLGSRLVSLAHRALAQNNLIDIAKPALEQLRDTTGETVHLAIRNQYELIYIDKIESREVVRMASTIGTRVPFHSSAVGKAFLAGLSEENAETLINELPLSTVTAQSTTDKGSLIAGIKKARALGYAFESEENEAGIVCFGGAIYDAKSNPSASVSVSIPMYRLKSD
ncbi:MAG: DNA-binding IclR family transcriptional regulator, partial [Oceanospirillaceae bacterium]